MSLVKVGCLVPAIPFVPVLHRICPLLVANDSHHVWHDFYASTMLRVGCLFGVFLFLFFFFLFRAALAPVQLLTWLCSTGASLGLLGGFRAGKSVCSCCLGAARWGILRSIKVRCLWADGCKELEQTSVNSWSMYGADLKPPRSFEVLNNPTSVVTC